MAEKWLKTYNTSGTYIFTSSGGRFRFYVIGKGGDGGYGGSSSGNYGGSGGFGGSNGGYAVHEIFIPAGEIATITIDSTKAQLSVGGKTVLATAGGQYNTPGTATGGNILNLSGKQGNAGTSATGDWTSSGWVRGGVGGSGASSVGKYQAGGASGGSGAYINRIPNVVEQQGGRGANSTNSNTSIGGAGGGGGGGAGGGYFTGSSAQPGGSGALGGVVIEIVNSAPSAPSYIDISEEKILAGKSANLLWGAAEDIDGNLAGYILERSADSGAWTQVYKGSLRQYTDTISTDWNTVQYRIKAYDSQDAESGYVTTAAKTIVHNTPPSAPSSLYLPGAVYGGSTITISWGQSTDADNNLAGYTLERCVDGGTWTEIANTTAITANTEITFGWQTVQFRVRAYDSYGAVGEYMLSESVTVINNRAPVVSGEDRDIGTMIDAFAPQTYTVTDEDGDVVTVVEKLDSVVKRTYDAVLGAENTLEIASDAWRKLLNGSHVWYITATDAKGAATARSITFTKQEGRIDFSLLQPLAADAMPERCILSIQGAFPVGSVLVIEVCNNAFDEAPDWNDITNKVLTGQKHYFANTEKTAERWGIGVRASLERGAATGDCYIHSIRGNYA